LPQSRLRTKILLALLTTSAVLSCLILAVVRYTVQDKVRQSIQQDLRASVSTFQTFEDQREDSLTHSTALIANLPTVRALMTSNDPLTIQNEGQSILVQSGADLLVLADRRAQICAVHSRRGKFSKEDAQRLLTDTISKNESRDWWLADGRLYQIIAQPIVAGTDEHSTSLGILIAGHEIDARAAKTISAIAGSEVVFRAGSSMITSGLDPADQVLLAGELDVHAGGADSQPFQLQLGREKFLATTENLSSNSGLPVSLIVLKSFDKATAFLSSLNRLVLGLGLLAIAAGTLLGFLISNSITRPLDQLVEGVNALEQGDYDYPLNPSSGDEVGLVTQSFHRMRESLQRGRREQHELESRLRQAHKMEAVGRLAGGVAHDFNNLLTIIRGHSDLLAEKVGGDSQKNVDQIHRAADRAVGMTRQLLAFSRMQVLQPRVLDLNAVILEMGKMLPRLIGEHIEYTFSPERGVPAVVADPGQIEQVLMNLAVNARDAMPDGGKLTVKTSCVHIGPTGAERRGAMTPGDYALITVQDAGHGMSEETKAHIFEPFFTTKEVGKGTGLGLATVYGIVKQSGGFIWVDSAVGSGTTFSIYLPASAKPAESQDTKSGTSALPRGKETILLVEDDHNVRDLAVQFLRSAGYKVLEARDGVDALEVVGRFSDQIHLLLTDMVMPNMGGKELASRLTKARPDLKVVVMSGYAEFNSDSAADKSGYASLAKPFSMATLVGKIHEELLRPNLQPS
jgi:signal transduction histidine kinase/CheY-like chemotaxis protein